MLIFASRQGHSVLSFKQGFVVLAFVFGTVASLSAQYFDSYSSTYLQAGVGFYPYITYGSTVDAALASASTTRFQLNFDAHFGWAIARFLYLVGGYDGVLDEIFTNGTFSNQISTSLISLGFRLYPFGHGLAFGADGGVSELDGFLAWGYGFGGLVAWDFSPFGINMEVGAKTLYCSFGDANPSYMFAVMPFVALVLR